LWPSVAQESAASTPRNKCLYRGLAAAHKPKAPVYVDPRPGMLGDRDQRRKIVVSADVQVARLQQNNGRLPLSQGLRESGGKQASGVIAWQIVKIVVAQAEQLHSAPDRAMALRTRQNADRRRSRKALGFHIPSLLGEE